MAILDGMRFCPGFDRGKKQVETVVWLDLSKVGAVCAQVAKERRVIRGDALSDHCNPEPAYGKRLDGKRRPKAISIVRRGLAKGIKLVSRPEIGRFLFDELGGSIDPV